MLRTGLGSLIRDNRERRGWSQQYIADQLNITRAAVSSWEKNRVRPC
jgi:transcriptional regulator with XRE-family HTH domain